MNKVTVQVAGIYFGVALVSILFGALMATFFTFVISLFTDYPVTLVNIGKTWLGLAALGMLTTLITKATK